MVCARRAAARLWPSHQRPSWDILLPTQWLLVVLLCAKVLLLLEDNDNMHTSIMQDDLCMLYRSLEPRIGYMSHNVVNTFQIPSKVFYRLVTTTVASKLLLTQKF